MGTKITDSLFVGDADTAQDWEFFTEQRITHVINCSPKEFPHAFADEGLMYGMVDRFSLYASYILLRLCRSLCGLSLSLSLSRSPLSLSSLSLSPSLCLSVSLSPSLSFSLAL